MVLTDLGRRLTGALNSLTRSPVIDEKSLDASLKEIATALLQADVNVQLVSGLRNRVKEKVIPVLDKEGKKGGVEGMEKVRRMVQKVGSTTFER
jgi:signal recognition particle subunit SRP54